MKISKKDNYSLLKIEKETLTDFVNEVKNYSSKFNSEHLIVDFSEKINTNIEEISLFLNLSIDLRANSISFIVICEGVDIDEIPEEISVVPTLIEALDILEMDAIERDLGF